MLRVQYTFAVKKITNDGEVSISKIIEKLEEISEDIDLTLDYSPRDDDLDWDWVDTLTICIPEQAHSNRNIASLSWWERTLEDIRKAITSDELAETHKARAERYNGYLENIKSNFEQATRVE